MSDILKKILARKVEEITEDSQKVSLKNLSTQIDSAPVIRDFVQALQDKIAQNQPAIIAEIKKASPSKGILRENFNVEAIAQSYAQYGAACLSVLTDVDFFQGHLENLHKARSVCDLPLLRKDFIIDPYQVYQARVAGADAILLIVAALGDAQMQELAVLASELGMRVLFEVHNQEELERLLPLQPELLGINNRNLRNFETSLQTTIALLPLIPKDVLLVTESGLHSKQDIDYMRENKVNAFLIGEAFMKAEQPGLALQNFL